MFKHVEKEGADRENPWRLSLSLIGGMVLLSQDQLHTMLLKAFQSASEQMESLDHWTRQQTGTEMQYWNQREFKALAGDVSSWLVR